MDHYRAQGYRKQSRSLAGSAAIFAVSALIALAACGSQAPEVHPEATLTNTPLAAQASPAPVSPVVTGYPARLQAVIDEAKRQIAQSEPPAEWWYVYTTGETIDIIFVPQYRDTIDSPPSEAFVVDIYLKAFNDEEGKRRGEQYAQDWFRSLGVEDLQTSGLKIVWNLKPAFE
jgi:hypothetical protein